MSLREWFDSSALYSLNACACIASLSSLRSRRRIFRAKGDITLGSCCSPLQEPVHSHCTCRDGILDSQNKKRGELSAVISCLLRLREKFRYRTQKQGATISDPANILFYSVSYSLQVYITNIVVNMTNKLSGFS